MQEESWSESVNQVWRLNLKESLKIVIISLLILLKAIIFKLNWGIFKSILFKILNQAFFWGENTLLANLQWSKPSVIGCFPLISPQGAQQTQCSPKLQSSTLEELPLVRARATRMTSQWGRKETRCNLLVHDFRPQQQGDGKKPKEAAKESQNSVQSADKTYSAGVHTFQKANRTYQRVPQR